MEPIDLHRIEQVTRGIPWMDAGRGRWLAEFLRDRQLRRCMEVGIYHGAGTCWIAGAIAHLPGARVWAVDLPVSATVDPHAEQLLARLGLSVGTPASDALVCIRRELAGAAWTISRMLRWRPRLELDFAYIDADHSLESTLLYFYLVGRAIRPGGWVLFDDVGNPEYPMVEYAWESVIRTDPAWNGSGAIARGRQWRLIQKRQSFDSSCRP